MANDLTSKQYSSYCWSCFVCLLVEKASSVLYFTLNKDISRKNKTRGIAVPKHRIVTLKHTHTHTHTHTELFESKHTLAKLCATTLASWKQCWIEIRPTLIIIWNQSAKIAEYVLHTSITPFELWSLHQFSESVSMITGAHPSCSISCRHLALSAEPDW